MGFAWNWITVPGLIANALALVLAVVIYLARPARLQNRVLALILVLEGVAVGTGTAFMYLMTRPEDAAAFQQLTWYTWVPMPPLYLVFLSTINSPLSRPLARPRVRAGLLLLAGLSPLVVILRPGWWTFVMTPGLRSPWTGGGTGPGLQYLLYLLPFVLVFGFAVAIAAVLHAPAGSASRRQAKAYVAAFGVRDLGWTLLIVWPYVLPPFPGMWSEAMAVVFATYALILAYGILRTQLFDIDLKIKWTLSKGTVAAIFLAVIFLVTEGAAQVVGDRTQSTFIGLLAGAILVFALAPLQRLADRVADMAMPGVRDNEDYRRVRKRDVYRAALEGALVDGRISDRERDILARLQDQLGLSATDARTIERSMAHPTEGGP